MARVARSIKAEMFADERVGRLSLLERWLWVGLITQADDYGVARAAEPLIRAQILPYDADANIEYALRSLVTSGLIRMIEHQSQRYVHIVNFIRHQQMRRSGTEMLWSILSVETMRKLGIIEDKPKREKKKRSGATVPGRARRRRPPDGGEGRGTTGGEEEEDEERQSRDSSSTTTTTQPRPTATRTTKKTLANDALRDSPDWKVMHKVIHRHPQPMWITWLTEHDIADDTVCDLYARRSVKTDAERAYNDLMVMAYYVMYRTASGEIANPAAYWTIIASKARVNIQGAERDEIRALMLRDGAALDYHPFLDE